MADQGHLKLLKLGIKVWNEWRKANYGVTPNFSGADLTLAHLSEAHLSEADLRAARLSGADLSGADLSRSNLSGADLSGADLKGANLIGAHLSLSSANLMTASLIVGKGNLFGARLLGADLCGADLAGADLLGVQLAFASLKGANLQLTDLSRAYLRGADFSEAKVGSTRFANVDLSQVKGIETVEHGGPSTIGIDTIYRSRGNIPEVFLRGAGVPESFITNMKSLVGAMSPIEFYSCFISYSSKDQEFATRLHADLQSKGVRCWFAPEDLKIGDKLRASFDEAIRLHDKLMVVLSEESVKSTWVEKEVETAFEEERQQNRIALFPIRLDDAVMETKQAWAADIRRTRHIGDFRQWKNYDGYKKALDRLLRDLKSVAKQSQRRQNE